MIKKFENYDPTDNKFGHDYDNSPIIEKFDEILDMFWEHRIIIEDYVMGIILKSKDIKRSFHLPTNGPNAVSSKSDIIRICKTNDFYGNNIRYMDDEIINCESYKKGLNKIYFKINFKLPKNAIITGESDNLISYNSLVETNIINVSDRLKDEYDVYFDATSQHIKYKPLSLILIDK